MTRWLYYLFKIWPFTAMTICPKEYLQNFQMNVDSNYSLKQNKPAKFCQRYWKVAKSGHTDVNQSFEHIFSIYFVVVFIVSSLIFQSLLLQLTFDVVFFELAQRYLSERRLLFGGGRHSSVVSSAHTILQPRVQIPCTLSLLFSICIGIDIGMR